MSSPEASFEGARHHTPHAGQADRQVQAGGAGRQYPLRLRARPREDRRSCACTPARSAPSSRSSRARNRARLVGINILATVKTTLGSLDRVKRLVKTLGMVNSTPEFTIIRR